MSNISLKSVSDLKSVKFHVPYYQRGYRWKIQQVKQLLDDINDFKPTERHSFYFLQALVVSENKEQKNFYVVDGQQRLTTLNLILEEKDINISYDRVVDKEIDTHYKTEATNQINEFFKTVSKEEFREKVRNHCKILWYEVELERALQTFENLNSGKIPVKDSELVKCILLTQGADENPAITQARAAEWDMFEREMNNDAFFAFMTPRKTVRENDRMTVLFRYSGFNVERNKEDVFPFLSIIQNKIAETSRITVWKSVCSAYYRLISWFNDPVMYHALGWFVHRKGGKISPVENLKKEIINALGNSLYKEENDYNYNGGKNDKLYNLLLLHNVTFCWKRWAMRYDFFRHRAVEEWSLEHIFARNQRNLKSDELKEWIPGISAEQIAEYEAEYNKNPPAGNEWLAKKLGKHYPEETTDDSLQNMALLPKCANSSLNNSLFAGKRSKIISFAENCWQEYWIPPATEAVFMKSLQGVSIFTPFWSIDDKNAYQKHIKKTTADFFEQVKNCLGENEK